MSHERPAVGTELTKTVKGNTAKCVVYSDVFVYNGVQYKSLSAAAIVAAKDLGLKSTTQDGWALWGLKKARSSEPQEPVSLPLAFTPEPGLGHFTQIEEMITPPLPPAPTLPQAPNTLYEILKDAPLQPTDDAAILALLPPVPAATCPMTTAVAELALPIMLWCSANQ